MLKNDVRKLLQIDKFLAAIIIAIYLVYTIPNVVINGLLRNQNLIGDPFYAARIKNAGIHPFDLDNTYRTNQSITGSRENISLGETAFGLINRFFHVSISNIYISSTIAISLMCVFLIIKITNTNPKKIRLMTLTAFLVYSFFGIQNNYSLERPISPQIDIIYYLLFVLLIKKCIEIKKERLHISLGVITALSAYFQSPFIFLVIFSGFGSYWFIKISKKEFKKLNIFGIVSCLILIIPFLNSIFKNRNSNSVRELQLRLGLIQSNLPAAKIPLVVGLLGLLFLYGIKKIKILNIRYQQNSMLLYLLMQTVIIGILANSNLITGKAVQFSNHFDHFSKLLVLLIIATMIEKKLNLNITQNRMSHTFKNNLKYAILVLLIILLLNKLFYTKKIVDYQKTNEPLLSWISNNLNKDKAILFSDLGVAAEATVLISNKIFFDPNMFNYSFSQEEINLRYFATTGCSKNDIEESWGFTHGLRGLDKIGKINRYIVYVEKLGLSNFFQDSLEKQKNYETQNYLNLISTANTQVKKITRTECIKFIKDRGISYIISNNENLWKLYIDSDELVTIARIGRNFIFKIN